MEKQQITISILGQECKIIANSPEEEARILKTAKLVQGELDDILAQSGVSQVTALVYAALNMGDRLCREQESMENLRVQITESAERVAKLEKELHKIKQEKPKRKTKAAAPEPPPEPQPEPEQVVMAEAIQEPVIQEPVITEPIIQEPVVQEPVVQEPVIQEPVVQEPVATEPVITEPVSQEPIIQEPTITEPEIQEQATPDPVMGEVDVAALAELVQEAERAVDQTKIPDC